MAQEKRPTLSRDERTYLRKLIEEEGQKAAQALRDAHQTASAKLNEVVEPDSKAVVRSLRMLRVHLAAAGKNLGYIGTLGYKATYGQNRHAGAIALPAPTEVFLRRSDTAATEAREDLAEVYASKQTRAKAVVEAAVLSAISSTSDASVLADALERLRADLKAITGESVKA